MNQVKLTLLCPAALSDRILDAVTDGGGLTHGFTSFSASGHGREFINASLREKVRGCVDTTIIMMILPAGAADTLLAGLRSRFSNPQLVYWIEPMLAFGDLG